jgi:dipeptidyl aminopeptidase/acylaminoacyl peptidase
LKHCTREHARTSRIDDRCAGAPGRRAPLAVLAGLVSLAGATIAAPVPDGADGAGPPTSAVHRPLRSDDFYRVVTLSDPQCAPDGAWVAYVATSNDRTADEARAAIWMVSWDGKQQLALTNAAHGTHAPRFSPDGRYLAYLSTPAGAEHEHLMLLDRRGGEARSIFEAKDDISEVRWSPDGARLVLAILRGAEEAKAPKPVVIDSLHFKEDEEGYLGSGEKRHLYLFDLASEKLEPLTSDAGFNDDLPVWSPDGKRIAFVRTRAYGTDPDGAEDIEVIEAHAGAAARRLARPFAPNAQSLAWSPDGSLVAFLQGLEPKYYAYMQDRLAVVPANGGAVRVLSDSLDRAVSAYVFSADSKSVTLSIEDDGSQVPARLDLASGALTRLITKPSVVEAVASAADHTAVLYSDDESPAEIYALEAGGLRKLSSHNDALLAELQLGAVEDLRFKSKDGTEVHGLVVKPPGYVAGKAYPTLLWIHGGPNGQDAHSFGFDDYQFKRQLMAANGYVVVGINYRGSSGRGSRYAQAIFADWGHREVEDLLAGVDALVSRGIADPARLGIGGWS